MNKTRGFTIVELLIVIVVIGILAAITIVSFSGVQKRAKIATAKSDLSSLSKQLAIYQIDKGTYPVTGAEWTKIFKSANLFEATRTATSKQFGICSSPSAFALIVTAPVSSGVANGTEFFYITADSGPSSLLFDASITGTYQLDRLCDQPEALPSPTYRTWSHSLS